MQSNYARFLRLLVAGALAAAGLTSLTFAATATKSHAATVVPQTVPALRQWTASGGSFTFTSTSRIVVDRAYAGQITGDANTFAADLSAVAGRTVDVVQGTPQTGDIALTLGGSQPDEGYTMTVGSSISIQGSTSTGAFWGTRTVLQLLRQSLTIAAGTATDSPTKRERGLMLDTGRRFFDVPFVENHIRELSYQKMNYLHLHLSDNFGFRLESSTHPEIASKQHYTKQDIANIIALGKQYHVTVVPEIDMPGHMNAILSAELAKGHDYRLKDRSGAARSDFIDLTNLDARTFMKDLIKEYLPLFTSSPYWHVGADEYVTDYSKYPQLLTYARQNYGSNATAKDTYYGFVNWANSLVKAGGKTTRMWNDGIKSGDGTIAPNADIVVDWWSSTSSGVLSPQQLVDAGHKVANAGWTPTYYVYGSDKPNTRLMYESWRPDLFDNQFPVSDGSKNLGSLIHVWCDAPSAETPNRTAEGIKYPLRALAQMTWGSPKPVSTYAAFIPIMDAIGRNPLYSADLAQGKPTTASNIETPNFPAANATDGNQDTRWSTSWTDPQWLQVDLGTKQTVKSVVLSWEVAYAKAYQIQISNDGTNWTTLYSTTSGTGGTETLTGLNGSGRYIRMNGTGRGTTYGYSLWEFSVYGA